MSFEIFGLFRALLLVEIMGQSPILAITEASHPKLYCTQVGIQIIFILV